jgi:thiol-disulfide isomerase/thioredoxin
MTARLLRLTLAAALVVAPFAAPVSTPLAAQEVGIEVGTKAPDAALFTLDSTATSLAKAHTGRPAVIYFWATWCSVCRELEPTLDAAYKAHGSNVAFVGVAVSVNQSPERVRRYTAEHYVGWTHLYDRRGDAVEKFDVPGTAYVVVVNKAGVVIYTGIGGKQDIEAAIQKALK